MASGDDRATAGLSTIERAFELARSGQFKNVQQLERRMIREGHTGVHGHLQGLATRRELSRLCRNSRAEGHASAAGE